MKIKTETGYDEWLKGLKDKKGKATILTRIARVRAGNFGDCEPVGGGVSELRIDFGPGYRVYFGKRGKDIIVLLAGSSKKRQQKAIDHAIELWKEIK